jgi:DNA-binding CsgD family transcriptional regulator
VRHLIGDDIDARADRLTVALTAISALPGEQATQRVRARVLAELSASYMLDRRLGDAIGFGEQSRHLAASVGDEATELHVASTVGSCMVFAGRMDEGWRLLEWAVRRSRDRHREAEAARGYRMMATCASVLVEYDRAETWLREGIEYAERVELWNHRHYMAAHLAHVAWATGDLDVATSLAEHALADGRGGLTTRIIALHTLGFVAMTRGDLERAGVLLEEARRHGARMRELQRLSPALWGLAEVARLEGDLELAMARCREGWEASARVDDAAYLFPFLLTGTRVLLAGGEPAAATAWVEQVTAALAQRDIPGTRAATIHARGLLDLAYGATGRARTALEAAVEQWTDRRRFWEGTWARLDLAACLLRSNRPADARRLLAAAEEAATARQAIPLAEAAEALRRKVGQGGAPDPWSPLTAREFEVAALIADGRTNGEIAASLGLATRTVASHVEHILAKLSVDRRVEVATWANQVRARPDQRAGRG